MDVKQVITALIIVGLTSLFNMYSTQNVVETQISGIREDVARIDKNVAQIRKDFYVPRRQ